MIITCNNCHTEIAGKYYAECGQKTKTGRLTLHSLFHEFWHALTHTDKGILKLIYDLAVHPKSVYLNYFNGQRKKYFSPVLFFLVTAGISAFLYPYVFDYEDKITNLHNEYGRELHHLTKYKGLILVPVQALITWLFLSRRYNVAEIVVFWLFCFGFTYVISIVFVPLYFPLIRHKDAVDNVLLLITYSIMLWHSSLIIGRAQPLSIVLLFLLMNVFYVIDVLTQLYLLFGWNMFHTNNLDIHNLWDVIKIAYFFL
jgi:hypothetical protein